MSSFLDFLSTFGTAAVGVAAVAFVLKVWIDRRIEHGFGIKLEEHKARLQSDINRILELHKAELRAKELIEHERWQIKRQSCLDALKVVDGYFANQTWESEINGKKQTIDVEEQPRATAKAARECNSRLALSCENEKIIIAFKRCLGIYGKPTADAIIDLREAIREELNFGPLNDQDRATAWIARINPRVTS